MKTRLRPNRQTIEIPSARDFLYVIVFDLSLSHLFATLRNTLPMSFIFVLIHSVSMAPSLDHGARAIQMIFTSPTHLWQKNTFNIVTIYLTSIYSLPVLHVSSDPTCQLWQSVVLVHLLELKRQ